MYERFYGVRERPFSILPDPGYLFMGRRHSLAYTMLEYGIRSQAGFTVITGEIGCGKTTLIRRLLDELGEEVTVGLISNTGDQLAELLQWVMLAFDQPYEGRSRVALFDDLNRFLIQEYARGRRTVLIIDEAQNLGTRTLEELRMLSNINADKDQLLQLILIGQPQLKELLRSPALRQFSQRVAVDFHIAPLDPGEVPAYIAHRLRIAGRDEPLFTAEACRRVAETSGGVPRVINILCDTALVYGFSMESGAINEEVIEAVVRDKAEFGVFSFEEVREDRPVDSAESPTDGRHWSFGTRG